MRILSVCYEYPPIGGGAAQVVAGLNRELVRRGHNVCVVTMGMRDLASRETVDGVEVFRVPGIRRYPYRCSIPEVAWHIAPALRLARRLVRDRDFDINHTHFIMPDGVIARRLRKETGLPYVITAHGSDVPGYEPYRLRLAHNLLGPVWRSIVDNSKAIVSPSGVLADLILKNRPTANLTIIPNGMDVHSGRSRNKIRNKILVVSRVLQRKGIQYLLRAVASSEQDFEVDIVGDGPYMAQLKEQVAGIDAARVTLRGWLDNSSSELQQLFDTSSVFVLPSESENFPVVLLEAMRAGLAIITTRGTGCEEVVGDAAILVPARDEQAIRVALEKLVQDDGFRQSLGLAARERIEQRFSWPVVASQYERVFLDVIGNGPGAEPAYGPTETDRRCG